MLSALRPGLSGPLYRQLFETLRQAILEQTLAPGARLPASRELGAQLGLSRNTVNSAYAMLLDEGYIEARQGSGHFVATVIPEHDGLEGCASARPAPHDTVKALSAAGRILAAPTRPVSPSPNPAFQPGLPDLDAFPFRAWSRTLQRHAGRPDPALLRYQDQGGLHALKLALRDYLRLSRNVLCESEQIVIVNGSQAGLDLLARLLVEPGQTIAVEEPGYPGAREAFLAAGALLLPVPVDADGLDVSRLSAQSHGHRVRLVYTTPSSQFPSGAVLSLTRRLALLQWAQAQDAFVLEDDYDSEFRFSGRPLTCLQGLDRDGRVIYLGTFSKVAFPGLRLGYLVLPPGLAPAFSSALRKTGQDPPLLLQAAMADFIASGQFAAHLRRMRRLYALKQQRLVELAQQHLAVWLKVQPQPAGMQLPCRFLKPLDEKRLLEAATAHGLVLSSLGRCYLQGPGQPGLYLGYSGVPLAHMEANVLLLRRLLLDLDGSEEKR